MMNVDEGIDLSFDIEFASNEFAIDEVFDDDFSVGNAFFNNLLTSIGDLYGGNSEKHARTVMLPLVRSRLAEVGQWLRQSENVDIRRTNEDFVGYFGQSLEEIIDVEHMNAATIFDAAWDRYGDEENLEFVQLKIYLLFGEEDEAIFKKAFMELRNGTLKEKIEYLLAERIKEGEKVLHINSISAVMYLVR
jgi:hypothetical protein